MPVTLNKLKHLQYLDVSENNIEKIPGKALHLPSLLTLYLSGNGIRKLPKSIGRLKRLEDLASGGNPLKELPDEIGNLSCLQTLDLSGADLRELPATMGKLLSLRSLCVSTNYMLKQLPMQLENCFQIAKLKCEKTSIPQAQIDAFLASIENHAEQKLKQNLDRWMSYTQEKYDVAFLLDEQHFSKQDQTRISGWLRYLMKSRDFGKNLPRLVDFVFKILVTLKPPLTDKKAEFRNRFFLLLAANIEKCGDRAGMLLNLIHTDWLLLIKNPNASFEEQFKILVGLAKTLTLREVIARKMKNVVGRAEAVEAYFFYEIHFKRILGLQTFCKGMKHDGAGKIFTTEQEKEIQEEVEAQYIETLTQLDAIDELFMQNPDYVDAKKKVTAESQKKETATTSNTEKTPDEIDSALYMLGEKLEKNLLFLRKYSINACLDAWKDG